MTAIPVAVGPTNARQHITGYWALSIPAPYRSMGGRSNPRWTWFASRPETLADREGLRYANSPHPAPRSPRRLTARSGCRQRLQCRSPQSTSGIGAPGRGGRPSAPHAQHAVGAGLVEAGDLVHSGQRQLGGGRGLHVASGAHR